MARPRTPIGTYGEIHYIKTKSGKVEARTRYRHHNGKTQYLQATANSKTAARQKLQVKIGRITPPTDTITSATSIKTLAEHWYNKTQETGLEGNTLKRYRGILDNQILPALSELQLQEATTGFLSTFIDSIKRHSETNAKHSRQILISMFALALTYDALTRNPAKDIPAVTVHRKKETRALTPEEAVQVRAHLKGMIRAVYDVMLGTGLRISEALALEWADLDLEEGTLTVTGAVKTDEGKAMKKRPKSAGSLQTIPLPGFALRALQNTPELSEWVFPTSAGNLMHISSFRKQFKRQLEGSGFEWVTPHTMRATVATQVAREGSVAEASRLLGHSKEDVTLKHYVERAKSAPNVVAILDVFEG